MIVRELIIWQDETAGRPEGYSRKFDFYFYFNAKSLKIFFTAGKEHYSIGFFFFKYCHSEHCMEH